jgi:hypothetical protein
MNNFYIVCDIPTKFYFQDPMSLYAEYIFDLHNIVINIIRIFSYFCSFFNFFNNILFT